MSRCLYRVTSQKQCTRKCYKHEVHCWQHLKKKSSEGFKNLSLKSVKIKSIFQPSQLVFIGFGSVAKAVLTLMSKLEKKLLNRPILIVEPKDISDSEIIKSLYQFQPLKQNKNVHKDGHATWLKIAINENNYRQIFSNFINDDAIIIELAYRLDTCCLLIECNKKNCLYINTSLDDWVVNNDTLFEIKRKLTQKIKKHEMTAVLNHGMNPGIVSHLSKYLLSQLSTQWGDTFAESMCSKGNYNLAAQKLGLTLIQIAERDTQKSIINTDETFYTNTWSVIGYIDEAIDYVQLGWGTHEDYFPNGADDSTLQESGQIVLSVLGGQTRTLCYEPMGGTYTGYCIPHAESYSLTNYLTIEDQYRPTIYYSYLVPDVAKLMTHYMEYSLDKNQLPEKEHVLRSDEILQGADSVGCLMYFRRPEGIRTYWIGSILDNNFALSISPEINATGIQVAISVLSAINWMLANPHAGIIEPEMLDTEFILAYCLPWLGNVFYADVTEQYQPTGDRFIDHIVAPSGLLFDSNDY